jgi:CHAD domain-containing protein
LRLGVVYVGEAALGRQFTRLEPLPDLLDHGGIAGASGNLWVPKLGARPEKSAPRGRAIILAPHTLDDGHRRARDALLEGMHQQRYYRLLDAVEAAAEAPPTRRSDLALEALAAKEFRKLRKRGRGLAAMDDKRLHKTRLRTKRTRYAAELVKRSRGKDASRLISAAKKLQDVLGEYQDAVVALPELLELGRLATDTDCAILAGRLIERQEQRKCRARRELPDAWGRVKRRGRGMYKS